MAKEYDFSREKELINAARFLRQQADLMIKKKIKRRLRALMRKKDSKGLRALGNELPDGSFLQFQILDAALVASGKKVPGFVWDRLMED